MPVHKIIGNRILTKFENMVLRRKMSEFHTGFRAYSREALESVNYMDYSNKFIFDSEILFELIEKQQKMQSRKQEEKTKGRSRTSADKIIRGLTIPKVNEKSLKSELSNMGAITPYSIASKYRLRLSLAKDFLNQRIIGSNRD